MVWARRLWGYGHRIGGSTTHTCELRGCVLHSVANIHGSLAHKDTFGDRVSDKETY
jgi:hypothetical protein